MFRHDVFPLYLADMAAELCYGFPIFDTNGAKVAQHYGAPEWNDLAAARCGAWFGLAHRNGLMARIASSISLSATSRSCR